MVAVHAGNMVPFNRKLIPAVSSDSADVGRMFLFQDAGGQRVFRIMLQANVSGGRDIHHNGRYIEIQYRRWS